MVRVLEKIHWLGHSAFYIDWPSAKIYIDPYQLKDALPRADLILITHDHFDHCSVEDIKKIYQPETKIVGSEAVAGKIAYPVKVIKPQETIKFADIDIEAVNAYNPQKRFHPKSEDNLGYVLVLDKVRIYHAGDTDLIEEMRNFKVDIALLPIGGTYTMDAKEAAQAAELIRARLVIPMHWGGSVGSLKDAQDLKKYSKIEVRVLKKE